MMESLFDVEPVVSSKDNEWFTPARYTDAARKVMGSIDLDPASCEQANRVVRADRYYTKQDNGLRQDWTCKNMWLNPPYGRVRPELKGSTHSFQKLFAQKLLHEYQQGHVEQAILLSLGNANCTWFQPLLDFLTCFPCGTLHFTRPDGNEGHFGFPMAFVYLGPNEQKFIDVFSQFGHVVKTVSQHKAKPATLPLWKGGAA